jgi:predicted RNA-binding Zn-ribbon protein involved in translation (DUF1610 family)
MARKPRCPSCGDVITLTATLAVCPVCGWTHAIDNAEAP